MRAFFTQLTFFVGQYPAESNVIVKYHFWASNIHSKKNNKSHELWTDLDWGCVVGGDGRWWRKRGKKKNIEHRGRGDGGEGGRGGGEEVLEEEEEAEKAVKKMTKKKEWKVENIEVEVMEEKQLNDWWQTPEVEVMEGKEEEETKEEEV